FYTLQGEGANTGRPAVFCRFAGCNLWSGREADRASAVCTFCDTDFVGTDGVGGGKFADAQTLADAVASYWPVSRAGDRFVVCTGGEPALQLDAVLIDALHARDFAIAIETNGTLLLPEGIDWTCVSPKSDAPLVVTSGDELKLVYPQVRAMPERFADLGFDHFLIQPMDGLGGGAADPLVTRKTNTERAVEYCLSHPQWRLSMQTHKLLGIR
ncbi:MAG: 7-carboxy-7-deazaguanine synthase, partial [Burkholderiaceae bacterium]